MNFAVSGSVFANPPCVRRANAVPSVGGQALVWPDAESEKIAEESIVSRVVRLTGNACNILHYTTDEFDTLAERAPELDAAIESEGVDLIDARAR